MSVTDYSYDLMDRLIGIDYADPDADVSFTYNEVGNPLSMLDGSGTTTWTYDGLYRPATITNPFGQVVGYAHDAAGNRTGTTYPDGKTVTYAYDSAQRLTQVQDWDDGTTRYSYDKAGQLKKALLPNGVVSSYAWDAAGNLDTFPPPLASSNSPRLLSPGAWLLVVLEPQIGLIPALLMWWWLGEEWWKTLLLFALFSSFHLLDYFHPYEQWEIK